MGDQYRSSMAHIWCRQIAMNFTEVPLNVRIQRDEVKHEVLYGNNKTAGDFINTAWII